MRNTTSVAPLSGSTGSLCAARRYGNPVREMLAEWEMQAKNRNSFKTLCYQTIAVAFWLGLGHSAQAGIEQVRGRGVLAFNFDFGQGISSFVQGDVRGGKGLFGAGGKAGIRYQW